jgi:hypothetical protein
MIRHSARCPGKTVDLEFAEGVGAASPTTDPAPELDPRMATQSVTRQPSDDGAADKLVLSDRDSCSELVAPWPLRLQLLQPRGT